MKKAVSLFVVILIALLGGCASNSKEAATESTSTEETSTVSSESESSSSIATEEKILVYSDDFIEVRKSKAILEFKNLTEKELKLDGEAILNQERDINPWSFGNIDDISPSGVIVENTTKVEVNDEGIEGEEPSGETLGGTKLVYHVMKPGETITWSGTVKDENYQVLEQISFTITY